jgi:hypothetical protein
MFDDENIYGDDTGHLPPNLNVDPAVRPNLPTLGDPIDPQTLHLQMRTARSKSKQHRQMLRSRSASRPGSPVSLPPSQPLPPIPGSKITVLHNENRKDMAPPSTLPRKPPLPVRSVSPDIETIISTTTRPQRSKSQSGARTSVASTSSLTPSHSLSKSTSSMPSEAKRRASEGVVHSTSRRSRGRRSVLSSYSEGAVERSELPYVRRHAYPDDDSRSWIEPDEFGINQRSSPSSMATADRKSFGTDDEREREERLERALEGVGSDSDSSLDIHTPLPSVNPSNTYLLPS